MSPVAASPPVTGPSAAASSVAASVAARSRASAPGTPAPTAARPAAADRVPAWAWLALGVALTAASGMRWGLAPLAWVQPVPFLVVASRARGRRTWLALLGAVVLGALLQVAKIVTPPVPWAMAPAFAVPMGIGAFALLAAWAWLARRVGPAHAVYALASLTAVSDWATYATSELGVWGLAANTQIAHLVLLQSAALFGPATLGFVMAWAAGLVWWAVAVPRPGGRLVRHGAAFAGVLLGLVVFGTARLARGLPDDAPTVRAAAVVTDLGLGPGGRLPDADALRANEDALFERTRLAADRGARLVVWNEAAAFLTSSDDVPRFLDRASRTARALGVDLVVAYGVLRGASPLRFDNVWTFFDDRGARLDDYAKHHPVPGEGSVRGTDPHRALDRPYGRVAGAICYDYDFPEVARAHAALGAGLVFVPSSDWAGIDPIHTQMARLRAIEAGASVLRPVRWAASAGFDPLGRVRGWMPVDEANDRVLVTTLPTAPLPTLYARVGDAPVALAGAHLLGLVALAVARRRRRP